MNNFRRVRVSCVFRPAVKIRETRRESRLLIVRVTIPRDSLRQDAAGTLLARRSARVTDGRTGDLLLPPIAISRSRAKFMPHRDPREFHGKIRREIYVPATPTPHRMNVTERYCRKRTSAGRGRFLPNVLELFSPVVVVKSKVFVLVKRSRRARVVRHSAAMPFHFMCYLGFRRFSIETFAMFLMKFAMLLSELDFTNNLALLH